MPKPIELIEEEHEWRLLERRAKYAAKKAGLVAEIERETYLSSTQLGSFQLRDQNNYNIVAGKGFTMHPLAVIDYCRPLQ